LPALDGAAPSLNQAVHLIAGIGASVTTATKKKAAPKTASVQPRPRRTNAERTASTRAQILDACFAILVDQGFAALSNSLIVERAKISSGALMHHFPKRSDLLKEIVVTGYARLSAFRENELLKLEPGLPRFRAVIELAWATSRMPEGIAVNEVRIGARSDPEIARATRPILTFIADDYGRFVGRLVREAGLEATPELQGLSAATAMSVRSLAIDRITYTRDRLDSNVLLALSALREDIIARQLGEHMRVDASGPTLASSGKKQPDPSRPRPRK
jgi:AcrR family transcriptional regulator